MQTIHIGVLSASDRASKGIYEDLSGKAIQEVLSEYLLNPLEFHYEIVADERDLIEKSLIKMCDEYQCDLVVTTGGTGPALRDITPEATEKVYQKMLPGFGELMRMTSLKYVPTAILSRQSINLPGKPKSIRECLEAVFPAIPYCVDLILGNYMQVNEKNIQAFRPKQ
ncbi:molybdopterin adenylyltransferase [Helicobacter pylori]|uniref:molybdopterin adenylyltransferase n=1 Tax=Helicobacter pylori TaxID=210 RepID=UPI001FD6C226|nr:molybdopterin adenylyltransferase [Helicobacter pylori]UOR60125.1 molybdopterin adenylyltransferase [Helicobacter pylori]